jgi:hypothetical protein
MGPWSAPEACAKLQEGAQDLGKARDPIMGCRRPATSAVSSLTKLFRRPRCTLRGARMTACTALQIRIGFVDLARRNCSACMRKAWCHQCLSGGNWSAEQLAPPAPHVTECTRWLHARPPRNSAIHARESALYRARCSGRALRNEDAGCISCALRSVWCSVWSFSLVGRADAVPVAGAYSQGRKCQGQP